MTSSQNLSLPCTPLGTHMGASVLAGFSGPIASRIGVKGRKNPQWGKLPFFINRGVQHHFLFLPQVLPSIIGVKGPLPCDCFIQWWFQQTSVMSGSLTDHVSRRGRICSVRLREFFFTISNAPSVPHRCPRSALAVPQKCHICTLQCPTVPHLCSTVPRQCHKCAH